MFVKRRLKELQRDNSVRIETDKKADSDYRLQKKSRAAPGTLFEQSNMPYVMLDDSKHANMQNGFTVLSWGYPQVYGPEPFTNWGRVLKQTRIAA
jgi:hypothetical protein